MPTTFDEHDPLFKCCTLCDCDVVTGTKVFLMLYTILAIVNMTLFYPYGLIVLPVLCLVFICTIIALYRRKPKLLWPFIIVSGITFLVTLLLVYYLYTFLIYGYRTDLFIFQFCLLVLQVIVSLWQLVVVSKCKRFYELKQMFAIDLTEQMPPPVYIVSVPFNDSFGNKV